MFISDHWALLLTFPNLCAFALPHSTHILSHHEWPPWASPPPGQKGFPSISAPINLPLHCPSFLCTCLHNSFHLVIYCFILFFKCLTPLILQVSEAFATSQHRGQCSSKSKELSFLPSPSPSPCSIPLWSLCLPDALPLTEPHGQGQESTFLVSSWSRHLLSLILRASQVKRESRLSDLCIFPCSSIVVE